MNDRDIAQLLAKAFVEGEIDAIVPYMADNCLYVSGYSGQIYVGVKDTIKRMKHVYAHLDDTCMYTGELVVLDSIMSDSYREEISKKQRNRMCSYGILLYQFSPVFPVAVVEITVSPDEKIVGISLSINAEHYRLHFYGQDYPEDLPKTVKPFTPHDRQVKELSRPFSGQNLENEEQDDSSEFYIWRKADKFIKKWLDNNGYYLYESRIFDDCIGYQCGRNGYAYTIYMYAYGQKKTSQLDGEYCKKLLDYDFSEKSTVLVVYLNVKKKKTRDDITYTVCNYFGVEKATIDLWRPMTVQGKPILLFYPRKEMVDMVFKLMYAFNRESMDAYEIIMAQTTDFDSYETEGLFMNRAVYTSLRSVYEQYGEMKLGCVRFNDVIYSLVPYIDGYGFFSFSVNKDNRIDGIKSYPFEGREWKVVEFIKTEEKEAGDEFRSTPSLISAEAFSPEPTSRFALKLRYDNGDCKKYVLPIKFEEENDEVVSYNNYVFTNKIWSSAEIVQSHKAPILGYPDCGQAITFSNGFCVSALKCYIEGNEYSEPIKCRETVYEDNEIKLERLWKWKVEGIYEDNDTGLLNVLIKGSAFNYSGLSTFASVEGKRITSLDFDYIDNFSEGLARVAMDGWGYGYIDSDMHFAIPMQYNRAEDFQHNRAKVKKDDKWFYIDKTGRETPIDNEDFKAKYQDVGDFSEGMCKVSTLKLRFMDLAYHSDYEDIAGVWGFVNEQGKEIIRPQYIYANDFDGGIAIVCKGKWTRDKKWDNKYNSGRYWTDEELWGAVDKAGNEVIPFIFDEIKFFWDENTVFMAHYGGWENGKWGVIDNKGNWLAEPVFEDIDYMYENGLFSFYADDKWKDDVPMGIYDINRKKVIFEPQFYDIDYLEEGWIKVEVFDEILGRNIEKIIDHSGNEKFPSIYSHIFDHKTLYHVMIRDNDHTYYGLIDENGNEIVPCIYEACRGDISYENKRYVYEEDNKRGIKDFDGNIILSADYYKIQGLDEPLLIVYEGNKDSATQGLLTQTGKEVLPAIYSRISSISGNKYVCAKDGYCEMLQLTVK